MNYEKNSMIENAPKSFEKMILSELGAQSLEELDNAMKKGVWPFKIQPKELWKKAADYFEQPPSAEDIADLLTGNKTEEEIQESMAKKRWPFNISAEQMKRDVKNLRDAK